MPVDSHWSGEMLWPQVLTEARVIDCSRLESLGTWAYEWLRLHPQTALIAATASIKAQLHAAALPVIWYNHCEELDADSGGVSPSEREMLWS